MEKYKSASYRKKYKVSSNKYTDKLDISKMHKKQHLRNESIDQKTFSFELYRRELSKIFRDNPYIIEDIDDFWLFVRKYESVEKKKNIQLEPYKYRDGKSSTTEIPEKHDPSYFVNINIKISEDDIYIYVQHASSSLRKHIAKFRFLICLYIDFKQKEKFAKLKKIRTCQQSLPIIHYKNEILEAVSKEKVVIIAGDTGCGKSTQIPQYLMSAGYDHVVCTQPRRIACISLSKRVSQETLSENSLKVGFQIRFEKKRNTDTNILFITEGLLLRQISEGGLSLDYDVVVLDEVHERHLYGDFLLGITKCLLFQKTDFKLILMSATINIELFANYFGSLAKVIQVPGRLYPIKLEYHPIIDNESKDDFDPSPYIRVMQLIDQKYPRDERGDVLMFLSGVKEITAVEEAAKLYNENAQCWCILPLHSSLALADQDKVFDYPPEGFRKCIISTNIAETSITIDGIRFVVDSGKVKEMSYDPVCKMQRLKEFWISRASAEQRKGRSGRTGPGVCFRLYSEKEYDEMTQYTTPEIQRVPLDSVLLQIISMGLPDIRKFPFIELPSLSAIENAIQNLKLYNALTNDERLTEIGKMLSKLPVDIGLGKMLITGTLFHQVEPILSLASTLSIQTPFTNKAFRNFEMQELRKDLESDYGDPITLLNIFREWLELKYNSGRERDNSSQETRKWCKRRGLEEQRFYEMTKLRTQFKELLIDCKLINSDYSVVKSEEEMNSFQRSLRHGELKQLRRIKQTLDQEGPRKPKILKADTYWEVDSLEMEQQQKLPTDIRDVEFRLKNNPLQVEHLVNGTTATSYKDLTMIKVVLCNAIYPQIAIPDEFNTSRTVKEQLFHTSGKSFIALHPNSYFAKNPKVLQLKESDIIENPNNFTSKLPISSRHQILFYMSLLETTKPYLVNTVRMPAAQSLLLFSNQLHTNYDFSRLICDSWIEITFLSSFSAEVVILKVTKMRNMWNKLLTLRLQGNSCGILDEQLTQNILEFLNMDIYYTIKRLLPADINVLYYGKQNGLGQLNSHVNPFDVDFEIQPNEKFGGLQVTDYMTYNCLLGSEFSHDAWKCDVCELTAVYSPFERLQHRYSHSMDTKDTQMDAENCSNPIVRKPNSKLFKCDDCKEEFFFTPTEILKHKREHQCSKS